MLKLDVIGTLVPVIFLSIISCQSPKADIPDPGSDEREILVKTEGKKEMILLTDRPPNLETPLKYFKEDFTPNDVFFVRWHLPVLPSRVNEDTFRLNIKGHVANELSLSLHDLRTLYEPDSVIAVAACAGNARSFLDPRVPGGQWKNGAMGNAKWKGVRLKSLLEKAGLKEGAYQVTFNGLDRSPFPSVADFVKSLELDHVMLGEVLVAYEMNGEELPWLNGYPLKLVVPGWYATYWVGMLNEITVLQDTFDGYWMKKTYLVPKGVKNGNEKPDSLAKELEPINKLDVRSIFVSPEPNTVLPPNTETIIEGLAYDEGSGIVNVDISIDNGSSWHPARLDPELGKYSWRRWKYQWTPLAEGSYTIKVKATNASGETQPEHHWNRSGYMRNEIESLELIVRK